LTYHGLFNLATTVKPGSLAALYRNLHLSVIYKRDSEEDTSLYTLVTDNVFQNEPSIVWERLEDIDGGWSTFVDSSFVRASPAGGDYAGQTVEDVLRAAQLEAGEFVPSDPAEYVFLRHGLLHVLY
jgi:ubiquitin carboxyl-terminal hydrolase MINDY-1/2